MRFFWGSLRGCRTESEIIELEKTRPAGISRNRFCKLLMGIEPIYPKKCLSRGGVPKYIHPYLLRNLTINHRNQVWSTDISYIPMANGFMYLYAIIDVYSRYVLGYQLMAGEDARTISG